MKFSVVYLTYRPGGYDLLADSLAHQTCQDYELICVDDMVSRRDRATRYLKDMGVKLKVVTPSKKKCFDVAFNLANAYNTGIMLSEGDYLVFLQDYAWLPPDALSKFEKLEKALKQGVVVSGVAIMFDDMRNRYLDRPISIWGSDGGNPLGDGAVIHSVWSPEKFELFYACASWSVLMRTNGFQECYDTATDSILEPFMARLKKLGCGCWVDHANICYMYNHREWGKGGDEAAWWLGKVPPRGSTNLVVRENPFNLAKHKRGTIENGGNMQQPVAPQQVSVSVPWKEGGKVLEIGGGDIPLFRPNLDMRKLPTVDIVCDLENKWPVAEGEFDGVFSKFAIEHMSWRKVPDFVAECFRVLKPGGAAMMIGPNTLEQCKEIVKLNKIGIEESALLFGGQEEKGWNEHKAAFSPDYAVEVFRKAGFERVETEPWPGQIWTGARTDMIIKAWKPQNAPYIKGNRHQWIRDHVKASESIVDLGCGPLSVWEGRGYNVKTVDERADFHPNIVAKADSVPLPDKGFDVAVLGEILEHFDVPSKLLNEAIRLARKRVVITVPWEERWSKNLNPFTHPDHKVNYTKELLDKELAKYGYNFTTEEIVVDIRPGNDKEGEHWSWVGGIMNLEEKVEQGITQQPWYKELENKMQHNPPQVPSQGAPVQKHDPHLHKEFVGGTCTCGIGPLCPDCYMCFHCGRMNFDTVWVQNPQKKLGLNIGSFTVMTKSTEKTQWICYDILDLGEWARQNGYEFSQLDVRKGIPWPPGSVDFIIASHFLEHTTRPEGEAFLKECLRVLKPGGVLRLTVPDTKLIAGAYGNLRVKFSANEGVKNAEDEAEAFWNFLTAGHVTAYDQDSLAAKLVKVGFTPYECKPQDSNSPEIASETVDMYPDHSIRLEGVKPGVPEPSARTVLPEASYQDYLTGKVTEGKQ